MTSPEENHIEETLAQQALLLFYELASDNLPPAQVHQFNAEFPDHGFTETDVPDDSWQELTGFAVDAQSFVQVLVGIEKVPGQAPYVLAKILLSRSVDDKQCHVQWLPE